MIPQENALFLKQGVLQRNLLLRADPNFPIQFPANFHPISTNVTNF